MDGLITNQSRFGPKETMDRLEADVRAQGMRVFALIDHAALAVEAGLTLLPTELLIFGKPRGLRFTSKRGCGFDRRRIKQL